jgi:hypothetical protein
VQTMCVTVREKGEGRGKVSGGELSHKACQAKAPDRCMCHSMCYSTASPYLASCSTFSLRTLVYLGQYLLPVLGQQCNQA